MATVAIVTLCLIVGGQWLLIWRLIDRLLMQSRIPQLGPVRTTPPDAPTPRPKPQPLMTLEIPD